MSLIWTSLALFALTFLFAWKTSAKNKKLPPGPIGFPIFGCLHMLGEFPHRDFHKLAKKYGSIMYLKLGLMSTIIVSSPETAELFLKTHDLVFASRPPLEGAKYMAYGQKNFTVAPYGNYWRTVRKMCTLELLSNLKINAYKPIRDQELGLLIDYIKEAATAHVAVDLSAKVSSLSTDVTCRLVFGMKFLDKEFDERGLIAVIREGMVLVGKPNIGDYIPQISSLDLQGFTKRMKDESRTKDFVDVLLGFIGSEETENRIDREHIKAIMVDLLVAVMDTSSSAIEWAISELIKNPQSMKKVQKELENVVGKDRMVEESDLDNLEYLDMVVKETLRLHPVVPLLLPRESIQDYIVNGFHIPKKSRVMINVWAIGRDHNAWTDPEMFSPERFVGTNVDLCGRDFQLIPFGSGRRGCPGIQLGLVIVRQVLAQLVHCFDWELPNGMSPTELDMTEEFSLVTPRAKHLCAIPTYRLNK